MAGAPSGCLGHEYLLAAQADGDPNLRAFGKGWDPPSEISTCPGRRSRHIRIFPDARVGRTPMHLGRTKRAWRVHPLVSPSRGTGGKRAVLQTVRSLARKQTVKRSGARTLPTLVTAAKASQAGLC